MARTALFVLTMILGLTLQVSIAQTLEPESLLLKIDLTEEEQAWVEQHPTLQLAGPKAFPPFHYHDDTGIPKGIATDYYKLIFNSLGIKVITQPNIPWPEVLSGVKARTIDVIPLIAYVEDRNEYLNFSKPYLSFPMIIVSEETASFIGGVKDLYGKRVACVKRTVTCDWLKRDIGNFTPVWVDTPLKGMEAVAYGEADVHIDNLAATSFLIKKHGLTNLKIAAPTIYGNYDLHFAVRKDWPILNSIINKALAAVPPETHSAINNRWLSVRYEFGISEADVRKWLGVGGGIAFIIILLTLIWNQKLKAEIRKRREISEALEESEKTFSSIFHHNPAVITLSSFDEGVFEDINQAAIEFTGYSREEIIGKNAKELKLWPEFTDREKLIDQINEKGAVLNQEALLQNKEGGLKEALISAVKVSLHGKPYLVFVIMDISERIKAEKEQKALIRQLLDALDNIKTLKGMLPICANCKKIRDDTGYWNQIEAYIEKHSDALFSHGICPECAEELYGKQLKSHRHNH